MPCSQHSRGHPQTAAGTSAQLNLRACSLQDTAPQQQQRPRSPLEVGAYGAQHITCTGCRVRAVRPRVKLLHAQPWWEARPAGSQAATHGCVMVLCTLSAMIIHNNEDDHSHTHSEVLPRWAAPWQGSKERHEHVGTSTAAPPPQDSKNSTQLAHHSASWISYSKQASNARQLQV